jgi:L-asparaginase / beta-aspartyl-peptidase
MFLMLTFSTCFNSQDSPVPSNRPIGIVVHGGAGNLDSSLFTPQQLEEYHRVLRLAVETGFRLLHAGKPSWEAVVAAVMVLEDCPLFNAGRGSVYNANGQQEMDAALMKGDDLQAGAVAGLTGIRNPIVAAKHVLFDSEHVLLTGEGAFQFALHVGMDSTPASYFYDDKRWRDWNNSQPPSAASYSAIPHHKFGTVGAVAVDQMGDLAAATSTGGMTNKKFGRVGDAPIIGAGTYADNQSCAVSATGHGEFFMRTVAAHSIAASVKYEKKSLQQAAHWMVQDVLAPMNGKGGVIAIDITGIPIMEFNTSAMFRAYKTSSKSTKSFIFK